MNTLRRMLSLATAAALAAPLFAHETDNFKLLASDGVAGDAFGSSVAITGTVALVGAPLADGVGADSGAVYVFNYDGSTWNEVAKLTASDAAAGAHFGSALAINGNRMIVGATGAQAGTGEAYAFAFDGLNWNEAAILAPTGLAPAAGYGSAVSVDGASAVVGAPNAGAAYVFVDGVLGWAQEASLVAAGSISGDLFGAGVTISGDKIAVGAPNGTGSVATSGVVNVFSRSASVWTESQSIFQPSGAIGDRFGAALEMYGSNEVLIGIPGIDLGGVDTGGSQRFRLESGNWNLKNSYPGRDAGDRMGESIALHDRFNVMGVAGDDDEALDGGTTYRFIKSSPTPLEVYVAHDNGAGDAFGSAVDISHTWAINGAPNHDFGLGTAYIHSSVQALVYPLLGSGINPYILATTSGPVIGQPWTLDIDLTLFPDSERTRIILKKNPAVAPIMTALGEVFFKPSDRTLLTNDALGAHVINVPNNTAILDGEFTLMGVVYGAAINGFPVLSLTNGETVTIGTSDVPVIPAGHTN